MDNCPLSGTRSADVVVNGSAMHYLEVRSGPAVLFLHGNPTSSLLWRHVIGPVAASGRRALALDLIGMGGSAKPDIAYRLVDHIAYVDGFLEAMELDRPVLVGHDWGAVIALRRALRHHESVRGVVVMEIVLPASTVRTLHDDEMDAYREPYREKASRRTLLAWPREIPIEGSPADVVELILQNQEVIADETMPTLLLHGEPGAVIGDAEVAWVRDNGRSCTVVDIGPGSHFLPRIGRAKLARPSAPGSTASASRVDGGSHPECGRWPGIQSR